MIIFGHEFRVKMGVLDGFWPLWAKLCIWHLWNCYISILTFWKETFEPSPSFIGPLDQILVLKSHVFWFSWPFDPADQGQTRSEWPKIFLYDIFLPKGTLLQGFIRKFKNDPFLAHPNPRYPMFFTELKISNRSLQKVILKIQICILIHGMWCI